jgi:hypothetical protein
MSPITLHSFDEKGLFVLPGESEKTYRMRVQSLDCTQSNACDHAGARARVRELFSIDPTWVAISYSNDGLYPWEAACMWYDSVPSIQLRKVFEKKTHLLGLYAKDEVLAHEYIHAVRAPFGDSPFEEFFAYLVSNRFRAFLGPLFQRPQDGLWFVGTLLAACMSFTFSSLLENEFLWGLFCFFGLVFVSYFLFLAGRLGRLFWQFWRAWQHLLPLTEKKAWPLMIRLNDEEIRLFSRLTTHEIAAYIIAQKKEDFRWQILFHYCKNCSIEAQ